MMGVEQKYVRFDWAVKRLLRDKANFGVLGKEGPSGLRASSVCNSRTGGRARDRQARPPSEKAWQKVVRKVVQKVGDRNV